MPHQCVRCNKFFEDGAEEILKGCSCGARLFFFIRKEKLDKAKEEIAINLSTEQKDQIEKDISNMMGDRDPNLPIVLDIESIRVLKPGKYELDLVRLFKGDPLIFKLADGKYIIDVAETFRTLSKKR